MERAPFRRVAVLLFDGAPLFESSVPLSVFGVDRSTTGAPTFEVFPMRLTARCARPRASASTRRTRSR